MTDAALLTLCRRNVEAMPGSYARSTARTHCPCDDVTITFRRADWDALPEPAQRLISLHAGPLLPDACGVLTMVLTRAAWGEIERAVG